MLPYFDDPHIAIVQSPQYFRTTAEQTWVERAGSAIQEVFYRSIQVSRDRYGAAICVGTCAIYRRAALEPHGGPHLIEYAEDVHTGLDVHKDGKRLVDVPLNLASGTSPDNIHAFVHQQVRWCTGNIFTVILGRLWTVKMSPLARLSHISGFFYYAASALAVFSIPAFPVVLLLFAPQTIRLSNLLLFGPSLWTGLVMYPNWHLSDYRLRDVLPLTIIRGWAHVLAIWDYIRGRTLKWEPSGANVNRVRRLWWSLIVWNGGVAAVWLGMTAYRLEQAHSLQFLITAVTGIVYASVTARAIYAMSERGLLRRSANRPATCNPKSRARPRNAFALAFSVLLAGATVAAIAASQRPTSGMSQALPPVHISKISKPAVRSVRPVIGPGHPVVGMYDSGIPQSWTTVAQWNKSVGTPAGVILYYNGWGQAFQATFAATARAHDAELLVDLDPTGHQNLSQIAQGAGDAWLRSYAKQVARYAYPVVIAFAHEMNGNWYPWGYGHQPASAYVAAWRHVVRLFREEGASNVTWTWTVNAINAYSPSLRQWWPGQAWVNWVGIDGYYYYSTDTFASVFGPAVAQIRTFTNAPIMIAETAVGTTSDRETQIEDLMAGVRADHMLGFVWFNEAQSDGIYHQDWRLQDDPAALAEFKVAVRRYLTSSAK